MALELGRQRPALDPTEEAAEVARGQAGAGAGRFAAIVSAVALLFSGYSLYETALKRADLRLYVPPVIEYAHPSRGPFEVFNIPITITNRGARPATVLSIDMTVDNLATGEKKRFYSAAFGRWRDANNGTAPIFSPVSVAGNASYSGQIIFYTRRGEELNRVTSQDGGKYQLTLLAHTTASDPLAFAGRDDSPGTETAVFNMEMDALDYRAFQNGGTLPMYNPDFKTAEGGGNGGAN